jgi:hypothetical protein
MSVINAQLEIYIAAAELVTATKKLQYTMLRAQNWVKDCWVEFHDKDMKTGQFGTRSTYRGGQKISMRCFKRADGFCLMWPMGQSVAKSEIGLFTNKELEGDYDPWVLIDLVE